MTEIRIQNFFICFILFALIGCSPNQEINKELTEMEKLITFYPDSALHLLEDYSYDNLDSYNQAIYYTCLVKAKYLNEVELYSSDSIIDIAINTFNSKEDKKWKSQALLYKGEIFKELGDYERAIQYFSDVIKMTEGDKELLPMLSEAYKFMGLLHSDQDLFSEAIEALHKSYNILLHAKIDSIMISESLRRIGTIMLYDQQIDSGFYYLHRALASIPDNDKNQLFFDKNYRSIAAYYIGINDIPRTLEAMQKVKKPLIKDYYQMAYVHKANNELDSAIYYLSICEASEDLLSQAFSHYDLADIYKTQNSFEASLNHLYKYLELAMAINESNNATEVQRIIHQVNLEQEATANKNRRTQIIIACLALLIIATILAYSWYSHIMQKKELLLQKKDNELMQRDNEINEYTNKIKNLHLQVENTEMQLQQHLDKIQSYDEKALSLQKKLKDQREEYVELHKSLDKYNFDLFKKTDSFKLIKEIFNPQNNYNTSLNHDEQNKLTDDVFKTQVILIRQLKEACPNLTSDEIKLCCLKKMGVPYSKSHLLFGIAMGSLRSKKYSIKKKMLQVDNVNSESIYYAIFPDELDS
ncbi:tetratricopeptide repeat protein [Bacteroidales bacterium OttesenSCG-928-I14]|nr:tetratricopeptide repeat protein [Bacteroidales bacterium OttesenSCG-928-I14]